MSLRIDLPPRTTRQTTQQTEFLVNQFGPLMVEISDFLPRRWASHDAWSQRQFREGLTSRYKPPSTLTSNMCKLSCAFMAAIIPEFTVSAGDCWDDRSGGMLDIDGCWRAHFWLTHQRIIIDPTASQFGYGAAGEILITSRDDPRYNANLPKHEVDNAMRNCRMARQQWLRAWRARMENNNQTINQIDHQGRAPA